MPIRRVCVLGGTGFVGRHLVSELTRRGYATRVLTRRRERHRELLVFPTLELVEADIHYVSDLSSHLDGCDAVVNLVGILNESARANGSFRTVHEELPRKVAEACGFNRIKRYLHMSALNAAPDAPSAYLRSKAEGENAAHEARREGLDVTSFRPSVIFGPDDDFFNRFALLLRLSPVMPLACPGARFAPVWIEDVAHAFADALDDRATAGNRYDLCGPDRYTLRELVDYTARSIGVRRAVLGLGDALSRLQARVMELVPGKPFTYDNYLSMQIDSVCAHNGFAALGITPTGIEAVVPHYLGDNDRTSKYRRLRLRAGRD